MDVIAILEKLQSLNLIRLHRIIGNYYQVYCPFHAGGQEKKPSCGVILKDEHRNGTYYPSGWWHCFACGYQGGMIQSLNKLFESRSVSVDALTWLQENIPGFMPDADYEHLVPNDLLNATVGAFAISQIIKKPEYVSETELATYRFTVPYMYDRRLTDEIIAKYDIGVDMKWIPPGRKNVVPCITFPVRDRDGNTLFLCRRSIEGKIFNYPQGVQKPVYGLDVLKPTDKSVIICESCFNALTAVIYGYPAVALLGTGNAYQIQQLKELGVNEFIICMDGDEAGHKATAKLKKALRDVAMVWVINMPDGKDINDCTKQEFDALYSGRE